MSSKNIALSILVVITITCMGLGWQQTVRYQSTVKSYEEKSLEQAREQSQLLTEALNEGLRAQFSTAAGLAQKLSAGTIPYQSVEPEIKRLVEANQNLYGVAVAFAPYAYDSVMKLHAPYYHRSNNKIELTLIETSYDYTDGSSPLSIWYTDGITEETDGWYSIYSKVSEDWVIAYSVPFYRSDSARGKRTVAGMVVAVNTVSGFVKDSIRAVDLGEEGYASIQNANGTVIYHPNMDLTGEPVGEVMADIADSDFRSSLSRVMMGKSIQPLEKEDLTGKQSWLFFHQLYAPGWTLIAAAPRDIFAMPKEAKIRYLIDIGMLYMLAAVLAVLVLVRLDLGCETRVWITSVATASILLLSILWIWYVVYSNPTRNGERTAIVNQLRIDQSLEDMDTWLQQRNLPPAVRIPTGIMIQNMALGNKSTTLSGYMWQQYPADTPDEAIQPPQFIDQIGMAQPRERYRIRENGKITVGWFFSVEIRQYFDVSKYPLDRATVKVQLEPSALDRNYVLVPDVEGYEMLGPTQKPGLSSHLQIPGWNVRGSYFAFRSDEYNVNFGESRILHKEMIPILTFNVLASRNIVFPIVTYCILIYVVVIQAFGIAVIRIHDPFQVLSVAAALFLVVAITHTALRNELASNSAIYLEYYFILLYLAILASSVTALLRASQSTFFLIHYRDNILTKTLFWPSFLGSALVITLILFHPAMTQLIGALFP